MQRWLATGEVDPPHARPATITTTIMGVLWELRRESLMLPPMAVYSTAGTTAIPPVGRDQPFGLAQAAAAYGMMRVDVNAGASE